MGFCLRCGEIASGERCRCGGRVSGASSGGMSGMDRWSATYLESRGKFTHSPNLNKVAPQKYIDATLEKEEEPVSKSHTVTSITSIPKLDKRTSFRQKNCATCQKPVSDIPSAVTHSFKAWHPQCLVCFTCKTALTKDHVIFSNLKAYCSECHEPPLRNIEEMTRSIETGQTSPKKPLSRSPIDFEPSIKVDPVRRATTDFSKMKIKNRLSATIESLEKPLSKTSNEIKPSIKVDPAKRTTTDFNQLKTTNRLSANIDILRANVNGAHFSKSFNNLKASVDAPSSTFRALSRKTSDASSTTSNSTSVSNSTFTFSDLLATRRGGDHRLSNLVRRDTGIPADVRTKRLSMPPMVKKIPSVYLRENSNNTDHSNNTVTHHQDETNLQSIKEPTNQHKSTLQPLRETPPHSKKEETDTNSSLFSSGVSKTRPKSNSTSASMSPLPLSQSSSTESKEHRHDIGSSLTRPEYIPLTSTKVTPTQPKPAVEKGYDDHFKESAQEIEQSDEDESMPDLLTSPNTESDTLKCDKCRKEITSKWFRLSDGRALHITCFRCFGCHKPIEDGKYTVHSDHEYHSQCIPQVPPSPAINDEIIEILCGRCNKLIIGPCFTLSNGKEYHPECFICAGCNNRFEQGTYVSHENKEYHKECVPVKRTKCSHCQKPIMGRFVRNSNNSFHPECFCCNNCHKVITPGTQFGELGSLPFCEPCLKLRQSLNHSSFAVSAALQEKRKQAISLAKS